MRKPVVLGLIMALGLSIGLQAHIERVKDGDSDYWYIAELGNPSAELAWILSVVGPVDNLTYLNKFDYPEEQDELVKGQFENGGALSPGEEYFTVDPDWGNDNAAASISWDVTSSGYGVSYVLVKDGVVKDQGGTIYSLYAVSYDQRFISAGDIVDVDLNGRGISHISWFGVPSNGVPDGGASLALLGLGLLGLASIRRLLAK